MKTRPSEEEDAYLLPLFYFSFYLCPHAWTVSVLINVRTLSHSLFLSLTLSLSLSPFSGSCMRLTYMQSCVPWLASNSHSFCLSLLSTGITGVCCHSQFSSFLFWVRVQSKGFHHDVLICVVRVRSHPRLHLPHVPSPSLTGSLSSSN